MTNVAKSLRSEFLIEPTELNDLLGSQQLRLFDATVVFGNAANGAPSAVSGIDAYRDNHIPSAAFFDHMGEFADQSSSLRNTLLGIDDLQNAVGQIGIAADDLVVLYSSQYLMWATRAWWMLSYAGHSNVRVLNGGLQAWQAQGFATEAGENHFPSTQFQATPRHHRYATKDAIEAAIGTSTCTIDALPSAQYEGRANHNYGRPGHIPGALSLPFSHLQNEQAYKEESEIRAALGESGMLDAEQVYTYCGGGIAATVDAFACLMCSQESVAVYDGSMSEWSKDPDAPLKTGATP